jgi:hypothetical protein
MAFTKRFLVFLTALLFAGGAWAQVAAGPGRICSSTFAARAAACGVMANVNRLMRITDSDTVALGATIAGGGANEVLAYCEGTTCYVAGDDAPVSGGGAMTGTTADTFTVDSDGGGAGTGNFAGGEFSDSIVFSADATIDFTRDDTGIVTLTCSDDDAIAGCTYDAGGASPIAVGSADVTQVTVVTDGGTVTMDGVVSVPGDITAAPESATAQYGANQAANNEFIGLPRIGMAALGAMTNGTVSSFLLMDDSPTGECAPIVAGTEASDATYFRTGAASYQYTFQATVGAGEGVDCDVTGPTVTAFTSLGFWFRSDTTFASGDLEIVLDDGAAAEATENMPAYTTANEWVWIEVDVTADCAATCSDIDGVFIQTTAQAPTTMNGAVINIDSGAAWIAGCEETIGANVLVDGVLSVMTIATAAGTANTPALLTEWTDYFVHYQTGNDAICAITDQSANSGIVLYAAQ